MVQTLDGLLHSRDILRFILETRSCAVAHPPRGRGRGHSLCPTLSHIRSVPFPDFESTRPSDGRPGIRSPLARVKLGHIAVSLSIAAAACDGGPSIRPLAGAPLVQSGPLRLRPIVFATDDYYIAPTKTRAEEGWLRVPERHDSATGRSYELHFIRFKAADREAGFPIVFLAGGPGGSGSRSAAGDRFQLFMKLRKAGDVIALDQRGVDPSEPHPICPGGWSYPLDQPLNDSVMERAVGPWLARCAAYWRDSLDIAAFSTRESAEDLEDLRRSLGVEKLSLWGISYGTHLALAYIRKYPERVHRAILAGVEGPDDTRKLPAKLGLSLKMLDSVLATDRDAREAVPDFLPRLRASVQKLAEHPVTVEVHDPRTGKPHRVTVGANDLRRAVFFAQAERATITETFPRVARVLDGDYLPLAEFAYRTRQPQTDLVMSISNDCASGVSEARSAVIRAQSDTALLGDIGTLRLRTFCKHWPIPDLGDAFRAPIQANVPVLAISGTLDNRTPPSNAREALAGFPQTRHLIIEGGSHGDDLFLSDDRLANAMLSFLRTGDPGIARIVLEPVSFGLP